jgi:hypothetical protein
VPITRQKTPVLFNSIVSLPTDLVIVDHAVLKCTDIFFVVINRFKYQVIFKYQGQTVHLFRPSLSFLAEAQARLENRRGQRHFLQNCTLNILSDRTNYKAKDIIGKFQIYFYLPF